MANKIDLEEARELASHLSGTLDLLASLHATVAAKDPQGGDVAALAATFAMLHANARNLNSLLAT